MATAGGLIAGCFQLGPVIGAGATGNAFAGTDRLTGEKVVIKQLRSDLVLYQPEMVERFRREGEALRRLNHPNIAKVLADALSRAYHLDILHRDIKPGFLKPARPFTSSL